MNLNDPELMRATVPSKALRFFGRALRERIFDRDLYHLSSTTEKAQGLLKSVLRYHILSHMYLICVQFECRTVNMDNVIECCCSAALKWR